MIDRLPWAGLRRRLLRGTDRLPWRPISELGDNQDGPVLVCSGMSILMARRCWGWTFNEAINTEQPVWTSLNDHEALDPQPEVFLPLSLPNGEPWDAA